MALQIRSFRSLKSTMKLRLTILTLLGALASLAFAAQDDYQLRVLREFAQSTEVEYWKNSTGWSDPNNEWPCGRSGENATAPWHGLQCSGSRVIGISLQKNGQCCGFAIS